MSILAAVRKEQYRAAGQIEPPQRICFRSGSRNLSAAHRQCAALGHLGAAGCCRETSLFCQ
tara:strand:- start:38407 stop:38589 length:183 start_codon:yes stop_codon:yes gene_type:complete